MNLSYDRVFRLSVSWSVGRSICHNFIKGRKISLPCSHQSTCFQRSYPGICISLCQAYCHMNIFFRLKALKQTIEPHQPIINNEVSQISPENLPRTECPSGKLFIHHIFHIYVYFFILRFFYCLFYVYALYFWSAFISILKACVFN